LERARNMTRANTFVFGNVKYLGNFFSPVSDVLNYCLIFMGPNEVLTLKVFLEVKWCIWSSTSATKPIKLEYFIHINVAGPWLKTILHNRTPGELSLGGQYVVLVKTPMGLLSNAMEWLMLCEDREVGMVQWLLSCYAVTWTISVLQVYGNALVLSPFTLGCVLKPNFG
jgi:hypothetical protein